MPHQPVIDIHLFDERDLGWIEQVIDIVERSLGQPWRILVERVEHAPLGTEKKPIHPRSREQILGALRRVTGGRAERGRIARRLRACVLGHPALDDAARETRIANAAAELGIEPVDVESLLWADLARERPVALPGGRPEAHMLAAIANVDRIQREMRRAREIELRVWGDVSPFVRLAARCGLVTSVVRERDGAYVLRITGPLALFHATTIYGRALGALVPLLAEHALFELDIHCDFASGPHTLHLGPPALLPPYTPHLKPSIAERLAHALEVAEHAVELEPEPIASGDHVLFPDLALELAGARWLVEVVGFSTSEYLADKLARYRAANQRVILCVDTKRSKLVDLVPNVMPFNGRISVDALFDFIGESTA